MNPVKVPKEVAEAFDHFKKEWQTMSRDSINLMFMTIPAVTVHGQALVLKKYAHDQPTNYLKALVNDYIPEFNPEEEIEQMITTWLNKPYVGDEQRDVKEFAKMVVSYFKY
ncbi:hypothetical protein YPHTV1_00015 [Halomonas phage YPHTV-1]|nr:hypothetical protein YPHTV1_00015 [Halomonas phage YPHTV-1]